MSARAWFGGGSWWLLASLAGACSGDGGAGAEDSGAQRDCNDDIDCGDEACSWCRADDGSVHAICVSDATC